MSGVGNDVPGAGVDPTKVISAKKRLKKSWRLNPMLASGKPGSFKAWVRERAKDGDAHAKVWLFRKSAAFTAEARKERKAKVRAAQAATRVAKPPAEKGKKGKGKGKSKTKGK